MSMVDIAMIMCVSESTSVLDLGMLKVLLRDVPKLGILTHLTHTSMASSVDIDIILDDTTSKANESCM